MRGHPRSPPAQAASAPVEPDLLVYDSPRALKAQENSDGSVTLSGPCIVFDEPGSGAKDLTDEYFTAGTYYGAALSATGKGLADGMFHHGVPLDDSADAIALAEAILPPVSLVREDRPGSAWKGWLASTVLPMREAYEADIAALAEAGKLGWSTGSAGHAVRKTGDGQITRWPIVEVSLTPTPAEPRTFAVPVKSLAAVGVRLPGLAALKADGDSLTMQVRRVQEAFYQWMRGRGLDGYAEEVYTDSVVAHIYGTSLDDLDGSTYYRIPYSVADGATVFADAAAWQRVERVVSYDPVTKALRDFRNVLARQSSEDDLTRALRSFRSEIGTRLAIL